MVGEQNLLNSLASPFTVLVQELDYTTPDSLTLETEASTRL